ncbi:PIN domain-containing protein, partial [Streptomyces chartreusis]|uniref:PIN domain-containing protein n=1 Tax=Streptomyces chartreusis TaxID=1969 RepID=UPI0033C7B763
MIVLLDTTVFVADPHCGGTAWRVLAHAASAWDVRLLVPEVVIKEAVAGYRRRTEEALVGLQRQKEKHGGALGISSVYDDARARIDAEALGYPETLHRLLDDIGAQTVSPPEISHMELVERATQRRKPCDGSGNGYRDTLNWISVLNAAKEFNEDIAWVSDNTTDFGREEGEGLHDDLAAEVRDIGAEGRVAWFRSLSDLILELTNERWPEFSDDLRRIQERLQSDSMESYLNEQTLASCVERSLSSSSCGFPLDARSATVKAVGALTDLTLSVRGASEEGEGIVEFVAVCPTTALVTLPITADVEGLEVESVAEDRVTVWISKDLHFAGIITSDGYGRPVSGEVTKVAASPDDPGRRVWARRPASNSLRDSVESMRRPLIDSRILESMRRPLIDPT